MKRFLLSVIIVLGMLIMPILTYAQAPDLGSVSSFVLFSTDGAVTNSGISQYTGNVGTNNGSSTGFGNVNGVMHDGDIASALCAADLLILYNFLDAAIPAYFPAALLGNGQTLTPGIYKVDGAATLSLELILDAQDDPNAIFIIQIQGSFSTNALSSVTLLNGAMACNVFWKVEGLIEMATGTSMKGTVIANNSGININTDCVIEGRALSTTGAVNTDGVLLYTPVGCGSPVLLGPDAPNLGEATCYGIFSSDGPVVNAGITTVVGDVGANVGLTTGYDPLLVTGYIHAIPDLSTAQTAADLLLAYNYLNGLPEDIILLYPPQFGANLVLTPHTYTLNGATTLTDTLYLNAQGYSDAVFIIKIYGAFEALVNSKVILINDARPENVYWLVNGAVDIDDYAIFSGTIISQGAFNLHTGATISGRALTGVGAIGTAAIIADALISPDCQTSSRVDINNVLDQVTFSPNPFVNSITINTNNATNSNKLDLKIYNNLGVEVIHSVINNSSTTIETENIPSGIYFYKLSDENNNVQSGRIVSIK